MKMAKVLIVFLLAVLVLSMGNEQVFASDNHNDAVERILAFRVMSNYPDESFYPEELVTREEMAEYLAKIVGLADEAAVAVGYTYFTDVDDDRASIGYINVCKEAGFINGFPNGTFQPTGNITYAEVITLLLRGLGYTDSDVEGSWPNNYIDKAEELGITDGLSFEDDSNVNRGSMAILLNNTLNAHVLMTTTDDYTYESKYTLLEYGLEIEKKENSVTYLNSNGDVVYTQGLDYDLNGDGIIDLFDLVILAERYGTSQ